MTKGTGIPKPVSVLGVFLLLATPQLLHAAKWSPDTENYPIQCAGITAPDNGKGYACNSEVTCAVADPTDTDKRTADGEDTYHDDTFNDDDAFVWTCGAGSFKDGDNKGQSVTWIAPNSPSTGVTITVTIDDDAIKPPGECGSRDDPALEKQVTVKVYKIRCLKVEATYDVDIYWPNTPNYSNKLWAADVTTYESNGTVSENWHRERIADIFRPTTQHYQLSFSLYRYPSCTTDQTPSTHFVFLSSSDDQTGWTPVVTVNTRTSIGRRSYSFTLTFTVGGRQVNGTQSLPQGEQTFIDYAIYATPVCDADDFTNPHLYNACYWGTEGTQVTKEDIPHKIQVNCWLNFALGHLDDPWDLETTGGDCQTHAELMAEALKVLGISADGTGTGMECRVGERRWVDGPPGYWEYHYFWEVCAHGVDDDPWNFEGVCKVYLTDEGSPYYCYYDKAMGPLNGSYQYGTVANMWTEWLSDPPPHHKVIYEYDGWE